MNKTTEALKMDITQAIDFLYAIPIGYTLNPIDHDRFEKAVDVLSKALESQDSEPVAWMYEVNHTYRYFDAEKPPEDAYDEGTLVPLYNHHAQPLSDDEIGIIHDSISEKLLKGDIDTNEFDWQFARAIEQAHGIK